MYICSKKEKNMYIEHCLSATKQNNGQRRIMKHLYYIKKKNKATDYDLTTVTAGRLP